MMSLSRSFALKLVLIQLTSIAHQFLASPKVCQSQKKCHTVKNVVLVDKQLMIQFLSPTHPGTVHDKRLADATPYRLPQGSHLLQDLGFLAFTLEGVIIEMPTKKPRGGELTAEQKAVKQALSRRRVAIEQGLHHIWCK